MQFQIKSSKDAELFLMSDSVPGIGAKTVETIMEHFGDEIVTVLTRAPERLIEVEGLGLIKVRTIKSSLKALDDDSEQESALRVAQLCEEITYRQAKRFVRIFGEQAADVIRANPYKLLVIQDLGFMFVDKVALSLQEPLDSDRRIQHGVSYALSQALRDGHTYTSIPIVWRLIPRALGVQPFSSPNQLHDFLMDSESQELFAFLGDNLIAPKGLNEWERLSAEYLRSQQDSAQPLSYAELAQAIEMEAGGIRLTQEQGEAILGLASSAVAILTGGPGTGKTTVLREALATYGRCFKAKRSKDPKVILMAPTGKAARRMEQVTGGEATTIHRGLDYNPECWPFWQRGRLSPLDADLVVIDETSMTDTELLYRIMDAMPPHAQIWFVGDVDQLPSVGNGCVLRDLIESESFPVFRLNRIHRQAEGAGISVVSHAVNKNEPVQIAGFDDIHFVNARDHEHAIEQVVRTVRRMLELGENPDNIQVLTPYRDKANPLSLYHLNRELQPYLCGGDMSHSIPIREEQKVHEGDRLICTRNNYDLGLVNGEIVKVAKIYTSGGPRQSAATVMTEEGKLMLLERKALLDFELAYAISIHRSQGSEFPRVVLPVIGSGGGLLRRSVYFTGMTRAKRHLVMVGSTESLWIAANTPDSTVRKTLLPFYLKRNRGQPHAC